MKTLSSITSAHWQPALGTPGEVVEGLRDLDQAIRIILTTPKGSDPHRPDFGSRLHLYIDWPTNRVVPYLVRESIEAIRRWEKRLDVVAVKVNIEAYRIFLWVQWKVAAGGLQLTEVIYERTTAA
ncbi:MULTISPECIES: GPW/gp25 family protein [Yersinia pseudotuberculosis complex]|uniref:GPW/gp25 family protein n=1 Tax=Yersinia pseudotuberculosis complex TaxID=1649845 RepID=UPI00056ECB35|nr:MULTISPECIES: GPW/gp25 family protein [Yersinia pseudotuberculosis complex]MBO1548755.1 baseplate protein [Yersinia pseudotuberculosis]MBO1561859.1 baseplate protein [Yersinia pseudotuberculosis]MBO1568966.1 baseplate protein [Yersinia pseudotuberculosis]MBO1583697.1 baseplate protein [Yersinia pseudotuberculosis]MBO1633674.1 baseplate protein [Yersinia pseudotuberculosis]